jgi:hypothetical protein
VVSNFVSGVIILLERSLKVGDRARIGCARQVSEIATLHAHHQQRCAGCRGAQSSSMDGWSLTFGDAYRRMHIPSGDFTAPRRVEAEAGIAAAKRIPGVMETEQKKGGLAAAYAYDNSRTTNWNVGRP